MAFSLLQTRQYTASASVLFRDSGFDQQLYGTFVPTSSDATQQAATNQHLASLPIIAQRTAASIKGGRTRTGIESEVSVASVGQANLVQVSATDPSPTMAARIANSYASEVVRFRQEADHAAVAAAQQSLQSEVARLPPTLRNSPQALSLSNRAQDLQVLAAAQTGNAELVQPASVPSSPSSPKTTRNGLLGVLCGLLLGLGIVFLLERLDRRIRDPDAIQAAYGFPLLGVVPESASYQQSSLDSLPDPDAEAFRVLRACLRYFNVDRELRSLLVTSAAPSDGKTTVGLNLALTEASSGASTVALLEADLRRPAIAGKLNLRALPGLSDVLTRSTSLDEALQTIDAPGRDNGGGPTSQLTVLAAGSVPPNPAELIESHAMVELLAELSGRFDFVVIDGPPASVVSDAMHLMRLVSGVVVVSRAGRSTRDSAAHLRDQLLKLNAPVLGVVANAVSLRDQGIGYVPYDPWDYSEATAPESAAEQR